MAYLERDHSEKGFHDRLFQVDGFGVHMMHRGWERCGSNVGALAFLGVPHATRARPSWQA